MYTPWHGAAMASPPRPRSAPAPFAAAAASAGEQRRYQRFDKVFTVWLESDAFGDCVGIGRNISAGGMFIEMADPLPLGSEVRVHFPVPDSQGAVVALGEVKRHYFLHYCDGAGLLRALCGMGVRFLRFEDDAGVKLARSLARLRVLH